MLERRAAQGAMACPSSGLPQKVVDAVREKAASVRALRTKWALLARDLLALLTGLRTAVMLDYVAIRPEVVLDLVRGVAGLHSSGMLTRQLKSDLRLCPAILTDLLSCLDMYHALGGTSSLAEQHDSGIYNASYSLWQL